VRTTNESVPQMLK